MPWSNSARAAGAKVAVISARPQKVVGADLVVHLPAQIMADPMTSVLPLGSPFELALSLLCDLTVVELMTASWPQQRRPRQAPHQSSLMRTRGGGHGYDVRAPAVMPCTMNFCRKMKATTRGRLASTEKAIMVFQSVTNSAIRL